ncbi:tripartite tricarboxylate transporter TctB family protein [Brevibacterium sp. JSBI002]|uniref:tripartite tricarboxylate transporter TctB family protein n=1 Tax=Brevibacterium sp. JSBI002 TaxID=2886045 RepID=UPI0039B6EDE9
MAGTVGPHRPAHHGGILDLSAHRHPHHGRRPGRGQTGSAVLPDDHHDRRVRADGPADHCLYPQSRTRRCRRRAARRNRGGQGVLDSGDLGCRGLSSLPHEEDEPERDRQAIAAARKADAKHRTHSDFVSLAWGAGGFAAFALILEFAGWIIAAALLFWCVARSMGSKKPLFDLTLALTFSSLVYIAFSVMLGLNLPSGILGGGF